MFSESVPVGLHDSGMHAPHVQLVDNFKQTRYRGFSWGLAELGNHTCPSHACANGVWHGRASCTDVLSSRSLAGAIISKDVTQDAAEGVRRLRPVLSLYGVGAPGLFARLDAGGDAPHPGGVAPVQRGSTDGTGPHWKLQSEENVGRHPCGRNSPCGLRNSIAGDKEAGKLQAGRLGCGPACEPVAQDEIWATRQAEA